jgi:hypothetical protein
MLPQSKLVLFRPLKWTQDPLEPSEVTDAVSEEGGEQIKNWLNLADAAFKKKKDDEDHAA